jgi:hypothetical protein
MEFSHCGSIFARRVGTDNSRWYDLQLFADVAQLVEHHLAKVRVASSNLVVRSGSCGLSSFGGQPACLVFARYVVLRDEEMTD